MTATAAHQVLEPLIGTELGVGDWTSVSREQLASFGLAIGQDLDEIPALLVLSLIPSMVATIVLPIQPARLTVNYGLDRCRMIGSLQVDQPIRARAALSAVDLGKDWLQVKRHIEIESGQIESGQIESNWGSPVLEADTITRFLW